MVRRRPVASDRVPSGIAARASPRVLAETSSAALRQDRLRCVQQGEQRDRADEQGDADPAQPSGVEVVCHHGPETKQR